MVTIVDNEVTNYCDELDAARRAVDAIQGAHIFRNSDTIFEQCASIRKSISIIRDEMNRLGYIQNY